MSAPEGEETPNNTLKRKLDENEEQGDAKKSKQSEEEKAPDEEKAEAEKEENDADDDKESSTAPSPFTSLTFSTAQDKGKKHYQQDFFINIGDLSKHLEGEAASRLRRPRFSYFAVYDGHGGEFSAKFLMKKLHKTLAEELGKEVATAGESPSLSPSASPRTPAPASPSEKAPASPSTKPANQGDHLQAAVRKAIVAAFSQVDRELQLEATAAPPTASSNPRSILNKKEKELRFEDGACCIATLFCGDECFVVNVGDSKAVLARLPKPKPGEPNVAKAVRLSKDHSPILVPERARIEKCGGTVDDQGRVNGALGVSRSFGDIRLKKFGVVATPDISKFTISSADKFLLLACDGLWGVFTPQDAVKFVEAAITEQWEIVDGEQQPEVDLVAKKRKETPISIVARKVAKKLIREAVLVRGAKDNTTCTVVLLGDGRR